MSEQYQDLLYSEQEGVARITLNRPAKRNAIGPRMLEELSEALAVVKNSKELGAVVLSGAGSVFCAGGDLSALSMGTGTQPKRLSEKVSLADLLQQMHRLGKPIVAMVNGHALAGGLGLMLACDLAIVSEDAQFGTSEIKVGLWPMMITVELVRNIGRKKALHMMLTGERVDASEAERIGLVNELVPQLELEARALSVARKLSLRSPVALAQGLAAFYETQDMPYEQSLSELEGRLSELLQSDDAKEGLRAFLEKRIPLWTGK